MKSIKPLCNFENIENKVGEIINTPNWTFLIEKFKKAEHIYIIGNGGNWAVATHAAVDLARLTKKKVFSSTAPLINRTEKLKQTKRQK